MKKSFIFVMLILILILHLNTYSIEKDYTAKEMRVLSLIYDCRFVDAQKVIEDAKKKEPRSLKWDFYRLLIDWRQMAVELKINYYLNKSTAQTVENSLKILQIKYDTLIAEHPNDIDFLFYGGAVNGYMGIFYAGIKDEPMSALTVGKKGLSYHEKLLKMDPKFYDANFSLGVYHFYASKVPWFVKPFLYLFGRLGTEQEAIEYFTIVKEKGALAKYEATEYLADIYAEKNMMDSAKYYYDLLIKEFPTGRHVYYLILGNWYRRYNQIDNLIRLYSEVVNDMKTVKFTTENTRYLIQIYLNLGYYLERQNRCEDAIIVYNSALSKQHGYTEWLQYHIGLAYEKVGKKQEALQMYKAILGRELFQNGFAEVQNKIKLLEAGK